MGEIPHPTDPPSPSPAPVPLPYPPARPLRHRRQAGPFCQRIFFQSSDVCCVNVCDFNGEQKKKTFEKIPGLGRRLLTVRH